MDMDATSDDDQYANESFDNDSGDDSVVAEEDEDDVSSGESEVVEEEEEDNDDQIHNKPPMTFNYSRRSSYAPQANYVPYDSSSEDDNDVVISETIVEINTQPMRMEDVKSSPQQSIQHLMTHTQSNDCPNMSSEEDEGDNDNEEQEQEEDEQLRGDEIEDEDGDDGNDQDITLRNHEYSEIKQALDKIQLSTNDDSEDNEDRLLSGDRVKPPKPMDCTIMDEELQESCKRLRELDLKTSEEDIIMANHLLQPPLDPEIHAAMTKKEKTPSGEKCNKQLANFQSADSCASVVKDLDSDQVDHYYDDDDDDPDINFYEPRIECHITSRTPTSFNSDEYAYHMNLIKPSSSSSLEKLRTFKQQIHRKSWSFTNERMREIERQNQILLKKILTQKPTIPPLIASKKPQQHKFPTLSTNRRTSAAVNRKKQQRQIDLDNLVLKRKIEAISIRRRCT